MFKYYERLHNYFLGRSSILKTLSEPKLDGFITPLCPENVDFQKSPTLSYEKVLELAKEAITKRS